MIKLTNRVILATVAIVGLPMLAVGQNDNSINAYSPYTFYGVGELSTPGTTAQRSMGGVGIASWDPTRSNPLNPASLGNMPQRSFLFNFGMEGANFYAKQNSLKTSYNTFNIRDISIQLPLAKKLGFAFSVNPYSSIGYNVSVRDTNDDIIADLGSVKYIYKGDGGINEYKASIGWSPVKRLSVGASAIFYKGLLERTYGVSITNITGTGTTNTTTIYNKEDVSHFMFNLGAQYDVIYSNDMLLTVGATYDIGGKLKGHSSRYVDSGNVVSDTVSYSNVTGKLALPAKVGVGVFMRRQKYSLGLDYIYSNWERNNVAEPINNMTYHNTNELNIGGSFTPNERDVRRFMNRITYRAGYKYSTNYMAFRGKTLPNHALTLGVGIPIKLFGQTSIDVGLELGRRGTLSSGLVRENYLKFSLGLSLFGGDDYWFSRVKYD